MKKLLVILFVGYFSKSYSQTDYTFVYNNVVIIENGVSLTENEKYAEAIKEFDKISKTDPKFLEAQYEKGIALSASEKKDDAKAFFEDLYKKNLMPEFPALFTLYANFLSDQKEYDQSEKIFKEGEKYLSNSSNFLYNYAILYIRKEQPQKSLDILKRIITNNPNHASSHYLLGVMALENGKITEGTMALLSYLIISPKGKFAEKAILLLNAKFGQNYLEPNKLVFSSSGDNFEEIETILRNQLPLKKAYKVNSEIDDVIIRQVQAVAEYSVEHKMGNGFFETTYLPWIKDVIEKKQFEGFSYYILLGMEEKLGKTLTSQKKKLTAFYENYFTKDFWSTYGKRKMDHFGKQEEVIVTIRDRNPFLIGAEINGKSEGKFKYLNDDGNLKGELNFKNNELDGLQKYYDEKGNLIEEKTFLNGKLNGVRTTYFSNGAIDAVETYKDDLLNGLSSSYYINGGKHCEVPFVNGERNGKLICLYPNGTKESELNYTDGKLNGPYFNYNAAGDVTENYNYLNGEFHGNYFEYYDGKVLKAEAVYKNGKIENSYKKYSTNKSLEKEVFYENGKLKKAIEYFANGKKSAESIYNEKEELDNYSSYDSSGNKYFEEKNKSGALKTCFQYSKNNPKPVEVSLSKKPFVMKNFEGNRLVAGDFEKGKKVNEWNYYHPSGSLRLKENYKQGEQNGLSFEYSRNGLLTTITNYTNDTINGVYESYASGKLAQVLSYSKGSQNGPYKTLYADGSTKTEGYKVGDEVNFERISYWQNGVVSRRERFVDSNLISVITYDSKGEENVFEYKNKNGKFSTTNYNGNIIRTYNLVNGEYSGKYTEKDKYNNPIVEADFVNGIRHNIYKGYGPSGAIQLERNYYNGKLHGVEKSYDLAGNLRVSDNYLFDEENGKTTYYYHNKSVMSECNSLDGVLEGEWKYFNQKGEPILILGYENNIVKYFIAKNKAGELIDKVQIKDETAEISSLYANGKPAIKLSLVKGNLEGNFIISNAEGKTEFQAQYKNNLLTGERTEYYTNGKIYKREHLINSDYEGSQEFFKEDGKPWLTINYKNDELHGNTLIYMNGSLAITKKYDTDELVDIIK